MPLSVPLACSARLRRGGRDRRSGRPGTAQGQSINGEHYRAATDAPWAIRYTDPAADVPSGALAYHPGGLYEIILALAIGVVFWALRGRLRRPGQLLWTLIGLYGAVAS